MAQYDAIVRTAIPGLAPEDFSERFESDTEQWSLDTAEAALFARLENVPLASKETNQSQGVRTSDLMRTEYRSSRDALWGHMWWQYAAAVVLVAALVFSLYRTNLRRDLRIADQTPSRNPQQTPARSQPERPSTDSGPPGQQPVADSSESKKLRAQLEQRTTEIDQLQTLQAELRKQLSDKEADVQGLAEQKADLARQLEDAHATSRSIQQKLDLTTNQASQGTARLAALEEKVAELNNAIEDREQEAAHDRELLDHDRDIRELMGARDLYIAEVYDVAKTGKTQKPFGRVFYTKGKSLIFYAYDLDEQPGIKAASTFQAWGRRGPDRQQAVNLGILYQDNANKKRWVVKSDDPKTLSHIDGVFVTVEPHGGSSHPSGTPLLFTYLRMEPNHP